MNTDTTPAELPATLEEVHGAHGSWRRTVTELVKGVEMATWKEIEPPTATGRVQQMLTDEVPLIEVDGTPRQLVQLTEDVHALDDFLTGGATVHLTDYRTPPSQRPVVIDPQIDGPLLVTHLPAGRVVVTVPVGSSCAPVLVLAGLPRMAADKHGTAFVAGYGDRGRWGDVQQIGARSWGVDARDLPTLRELAGNVEFIVDEPEADRP